MKRLNILMFLIASIDCANILATLLVPLHSHVVYQENLIKALLDRGHNVTVISEILLKEHTNLTQIRLNESVELKKMNFLKFKTNNKLFEDLKMFLLVLRTLLSQLRSENLHKFIQDGHKNHFDLLIFDKGTFHPLLAFSEVYNCPIVATFSTEATLFIHSMLGNDVNPVLHPEYSQFPQLAGELNFCQRLGSVLIHSVVFGVFIPIINVLSYYQMKKYFPNVTSSPHEIGNRVALLITNTNPSMGSIKPAVNQIHASFLHIQPPKPLFDSKLKTFVDASEKGFILMTFGSIVNTTRLEPGLIQIFLNVFERLDYKVVLKFEDETLRNKSHKLFTSKWVPQADLLAHPNVKLFITHGGMLSVQEAIDRTVPMVLFPICGDQPFNARISEINGVGISLDMNTITENLLEETIEEVLKPKYKESMKRLRERVYDEPMTSRDKAVWWIEHVIRNKGAVLKYNGRNVPFYQKHCLDIVLAFSITFYICLKLFLILFKTTKRHIKIKPKEN